MPGEHITAFRLPLVRACLTIQRLRQEDSVRWFYAKPERYVYLHKEHEVYYPRCRVPIRSDRELFLGYLPLPYKYHQAWLDLCYTVVYLEAILRCWETAYENEELRDRKELIHLGLSTAGNRLLQHIVARMHIVQELLTHSPHHDHDSETLPIFDEYIVRNRFDALFTEWQDVPDLVRNDLVTDPLHDRHKERISMLTSDQFSQH